MRVAGNHVTVVIKDRFNRLLHTPLYGLLPPHIKLCRQQVNGLIGLEINKPTRLRSAKFARSNKQFNISLDKDLSSYSKSG